MTEILAPAGSIECAYAAIHSGADAIYLGTRAFSARASAENFDEDGLSSLLRYAKLLGVKVYVAMNTLVKDSELSEFFHTLVKCWNLGVDAIILQDIALGQYVHEHRPEICLHLSTQAGVCNVSGAKFAKECGFSRVILARETPIDEIKKIAEIIETEVFVQGALCTCFSGQCYFSSFVGGNSGNRGRCKQPCRKQYSFNRNGYEDLSYALSPSDLCVGKEIEKLKEAGVSSFKIEGRMRRPEYVAAATAYYRALLDGKEDAGALSALKRTYNRGNYTKGLAFGQDKSFLSSNIQGHLGEKVGIVKVENKKYVVDSSFVPVQGDAFKILRKGKEVGGAFFAGNARKGFFINSTKRLCAGDTVFVTTDTALNTSLLSAKKVAKISIALDFCEGEKAIAQGVGVRLVSAFTLDSAKNNPLTEEDLRTCFKKTDNLPVEIDFSAIRLNGNIFLPKSLLNQFRRDFFQAIVDSVCKNRQLSPIEYIEENLPKNNKKSSKKMIIVRELSTILDVDEVVYKPDNYAYPLPDAFLKGNHEKYLYCPAYCTDEEMQLVFNIVKENNLDGVYAENFAAFYKAREEGVKCHAGTGFNVTNRISAAFWIKQENISGFKLSKELSTREGQGLVCLEKAGTMVGGDIKLMDLCYCPFEKTCSGCDKRPIYIMTDEQGREYPVHRYVLGGKCRFEIYNNARLIALPQDGVDGLADYTMTSDLPTVLSCWKDEEKQKLLQKKYTFGHAKNGVL